MTFSICNVQGIQATPPLKQSPLLIPPPPSAPYWTYTTSGLVRAVAVSADGSTIVAGNESSRIYVFGRQSNTTIWTYTTSGNVYSVAVSANGSTIVEGGIDAYVRVFGRENNTPIWSYNTGNVIRSVAVSADGSTIVAGGGDNYVHVFSRQSNTALWNYKTNDHVHGVAVSRDGTTIATGGEDGYFRVFGRTSNTTLVQYNTGRTIYQAIALSSDGSTIACGSIGPGGKAYLFSKGLGLLWNYDVGSVCEAYVGPAVGISDDGSLIAYGTDAGKLYVFQYDTTPPVMGTSSILPSSPVGGQSVNISISVTDNVAVSTVTLYYRNTSSSSWSSAAMSLAGSVYRAKIGPFAAGSVITYYVTAEDASGNTASSPADAPLSYYMFTVGQPPGGLGIEWTSVLIGAGLGAIIAIIVSFVLLRGKRGRR